MAEPNFGDDADIFGPTKVGRMTDAPAAAGDEDIFKAPKARTEPAAKPKPAVEPSFLDRVAGAPTTMLATGAASPFLGAAQIASRMTPAQNFAVAGPLGVLAGLGAQAGGIDDTLSSLQGMQQRGGVPYMSKAYEFLGNVLNPAGLGVAKAMPIAAHLPGRMGQGALFGAGTGATTPVTQDAENSFWKQKGVQTGVGAGLGALMAPVIDTAGAVYRGGRNILEGAGFLGKGGTERSAGRLGLAASGERTPGVLSELDNARPLVPGSNPTAGEAAVNAGSTEFAALQRIAKENDPSAYHGVLQQQEAARRGAIRQGISGTDQDLSSRIAQRGADAKVNYGAADKDIVTVDGKLQQLLSRPSMEKAMAAAEKLAKEEQRVISFQLKPKQQLSSEGDFLVTTPGGPQKYTVEHLHYLKRAMDDMIRDPRTAGIAADEARAIGATQREFMKWIETKSPKYGFARSEYRDASEPINQMQIGREIEGRLTSPSGTETKGSFLRSLDDSAKVIKDATGQSRYDKLHQVLTPKQFGVAQSVGDDLERSLEFARQAQVGMPKARQIVGESGAAPTVKGFVNRELTIFNTIMSRLEGKATEHTMAELSRAMQNPQEMARIMRAATPSEQRELFKAMYLPLGVGAPIHGVLGNSQGVLAK